MKKITITLLAIIISMAAFSQAGIKIGPVASQFYGGEEVDFRAKMGLTVGLYDRIYLGKSISLQPELLYSNKGSLINHEGPTRQSEQYRQNFSYIELPVSINVHVTKNLEIHGGAYAAYLVRAYISKWNYDNTIKEHNLDGFYKLDYGGVYGLSYDCSGLIFQLQGTYGMKQLGKPGFPYGWSAANRAYRNATYSASVLLPFKIKE